MNIVSKKRMEFQLIRDMRTDKVQGLHDSFRLPNDKGKMQIITLRRVMEKEGSEFDIICHSLAIRTYCLALALSNSHTILVEIPQLYDPNPKSANPIEATDATVLIEAKKRNGYDWAKWQNDDSARVALARHAEVAAEKFYAALKAILLESANDLVRDKLLLRVGVVGHFPYLNIMGMYLTRSLGLHEATVAYKIPLAECERFVMNGPWHHLETVIHVPLGEKILQGDPEGLN